MCLERLEMDVVGLGIHYEDLPVGRQFRTEDYRQDSFDDKARIPFQVYGRASNQRTNARLPSTVSRPVAKRRMASG